MKPCTKCGELWNEWAFLNGGNICPDCHRAYCRAYYHQTKAVKYKQHLLKNMRAYHRDSTSALSNAPTRQQCTACGIVKGKKSFVAGHDVCRRCERSHQGANP